MCSSDLANLELVNFAKSYPFRGRFAKQRRNDETDEWDSDNGGAKAGERNREFFEKAATGDFLRRFYAERRVVSGVFVHSEFL